MCISPLPLLPDNDLLQSTSQTLTVVPADTANTYYKKRMSNNAAITISIYSTVATTYIWFLL